MGWLPKSLFKKSRQFKAAHYVGLLLLLAGSNQTSGFFISLPDGVAK